MGEKAPSPCVSRTAYVSQMDRQPGPPVSRPSAREQKALTEKGARQRVRQRHKPSILQQDRFPRGTARCGEQAQPRTREQHDKKVITRCSKTAEQRPHRRQSRMAVVVNRRGAMNSLLVSPFRQQHVDYGAGMASMQVVQGLGELVGRIMVRASEHADLHRARPSKMGR